MAGLNRLSPLEYQLVELKCLDLQISSYQLLSLCYQCHSITALSFMPKMLGDSGSLLARQLIGSTSLLLQHRSGFNTSTSSKSRIASCLLIFISRQTRFSSSISSSVRSTLIYDHSIGQKLCWLSYLGVLPRQNSSNFCGQCYVNVNAVPVFVCSMVALIYKISGDAAEKENRRAALILCLHSTAVSVTPRLKISNIQLHVIQNVNSQSHRSCRTYCNTLNRCVSCQLCVPYFLTLSSNKTV